MALIGAKLALRPVIVQSLISFIDMRKTLS